MLDILKSLNVLYIDDDKIARDEMNKTLSYFFNTVYVVDNGEKGIELYHKQNIHLLLVDYDMPIMDGYSFLKEVRKTNSLIPAVIISSYSEKEKLFNAIKLNLVEYLTRPFSFSDLKRVLLECAEWIEKHGLLQTTLSSDSYYDFATKTIVKEDSQGEKLTNYEYRIVELLLRHEKQAVSFEEILASLNNPNSTKKSLISIVYKINKKLPTPMITNLADVGYVFSRG